MPFVVTKHFVHTLPVEKAASHHIHYPSQSRDAEHRDSSLYNYEHVSLELGVYNNIVSQWLDITS